MTRCRNAEGSCTYWDCVDPAVAEIRDAVWLHWSPVCAFHLEEHRENPGFEERPLTVETGA